MPSTCCSPILPAPRVFEDSPPPCRESHTTALCKTCVSPLLFVHPQGILPVQDLVVCCVWWCHWKYRVHRVFTAQRCAFFPDKWTTALRPKDSFQTKEPIGGLPYAVLLLAELRCPSSRFTLGTLGWNTWCRASAWGNFWARASGLRTKEKIPKCRTVGEDAGS